MELPRGTERQRKEAPPSARWMTGKELSSRTYGAGSILLGRDDNGAMIGANGNVIETERAMWDIATAAGTERVLAYRGHNPRDEVFSLNMHLNNFFDYWRNLVEPIQADIDEYEAMTTDDTVSDDAKRSARGAIYNLVLDQYRETKPPWNNG